MASYDGSEAGQSIKDGLSEVAEAIADTKSDGFGVQVQIHLTGAELTNLPASYLAEKIRALERELNGD